MILEKLDLQNFRSYKKKEFKFSSKETTLVVGPNTSGKTNLLEAIYLLATGKSFRAGVEGEMIAHGKELARVQTVVAYFPTSAAEVTYRNFGSTSDSLAKKHMLLNEIHRRSQDEASQNLVGSPRRLEALKLEIVLTTGQVLGKKTAKKRYLVNGVGKRRLDFVGQLRCVLFGPEDLEIILGSPSIRRNYLDSVLEQVDREYRRANLSYQKGLRQRNKLLEQIREKGRPRSVLFFWDKLLIENGQVITQKREEFINFINQQPDYFGALEIEYDQSLISPQRLEKYAEQEVAAGMTLVGPHRDDFRIRINPNKNNPNKSELGRDLAIYGSRGEQRTAVLSLKLAELEFVNQKTEETPVLLLDDIFSELDQAHRARIFEIIPQQQTIITTTDLELIGKKYRKKVKIIQL